MDKTAQLASSPAQASPCAAWPAPVFSSSPPSCASSSRAARGRERGGGAMTDHEFSGPANNDNDVVIDLIDGDIVIVTAE